MNRWRLVDEEVDMKLSERSRTKCTKKRSPHEQTAAAALLEKLRQGADLRARKARRLRGAVRADRYENDLKLAIALDKLMHEL
jgi:hypothetical protein